MGEATGAGRELVMNRGCGPERRVTVMGVGSPMGDENVPELDRGVGCTALSVIELVA